MPKPTVAIPTHGLDAHSNQHWEKLQYYLTALRSSGFNIALIPLLSSARERRKLIKTADALCLVGGEDVEPSQYGTRAQKKFNVIFDHERDEFELEILEDAIDKEVPLLTVCRGMQLLNVYLGGTLWQDLTLQAKLRERHRQGDSTVVTHPITITPGSQLYEAVGRKRLTVKSNHHQGIRKLAPELEAIAKSPGGIIEAVQIKNYGSYSLGVQFHPERVYKQVRWSRAIFDSFAAAVRS